jgi:lipopolysaccharide export system protein LptA
VTAARLLALLLGAALLGAMAPDASAQPRGRQPAVRSEAPAPKPGEDERSRPVTVDADQMESLQKEGLVIFTGNVVARHDNSVQYADRTEVYLDPRGERIVRTVSVGNVKIVTRDCRVGTANRAEYHDADQRVVLSGNARVWQDDNMVTGDRITIYLAEERSLVQGGKTERVKAIFYPRAADGRRAERPPGPCQ